MFYLIFLLLGFLSFAQESPEVLLKQQQTLLERQIQDQMFQSNIQKGFNLEINTQDENFKPQETQTCFKLQKVNFNQSKYLSIRTQTKIVKEFIGQCIPSKHQHLCKK